MNSEKNAEWIKTQRRKIIKEINSIMELVATEVLKPHYKPKYHLDFHIGMSGKNVGIIVWSDSEMVEKADAWCLDMTLEEGFIYFRKDDIEKQVRETMGKLKKIRECAEKYVKLNAKQQRNG